MNANPEATKFEVITGNAPAKNVTGAIPSEAPDPPAKLSPKEKKLWDHITAALYEYGLVHRTDGLALTVICKTFTRWVEAEEQLSTVIKDNGGHYMVKAGLNGYEQPHQLYYVSRNLKKELLQWLPEAALTIPSFHKIMGEKLAPEQGSLFDDPVKAHKDRLSKIGMRAAT